ncbi:tRNA uridine 5-carboxymethylaminomethyl modification enzyme MnmG [Candidatus Hodgkinia cicadicola]|nr:tRNA uridine 5-carboxymethylaminomethyl modification enzyme MnmG [Candidatus Hodgkinia cicadicola]
MCWQINKISKISQPSNTSIDYDIVVIGCGHAGLEAIITASKYNLKTAIITASKSTIGNLSCNPSIGGVGKSHLVYELSCLGGVMGIISDRSALVAHILNSSKGKSAQSLRIQVDTKLYKLLSIRTLLMSKIRIINAVVLQIRRILTGFEIKLENSDLIKTKILILTVGTFVRSICHVGECSLALDKLKNKSSDCVYNFLKTYGVSFKRLKTGTSPRLKKKSIRWEKIPSELNMLKHGFYGSLNRATLNMNCKPTYTNENFHTIIRDNISKSALQAGRMLAKGPRYCISVENKVLKFHNKLQKLIVEPESINSSSVYINGLSISAPIEVQSLALKSINMFSNIEVLKAGYAIEYDSICCNDLKSTLECSKISNVYIAGQINGTTGYEEAGIQGFIAGLNAACKVSMKREYTFNRRYSYTGILINDITHNTLSEPYRISTTRSENRTQLRQYNTALRLIPYTLSIDILARSRQFKQMRWINAIKIFLLKLNNSKIATISPSEMHLLLNKLNLVSVTMWQKLIILQWKS